MLVHSDWPEIPLALADEAADREMGWVIRAIEQVRSVRAEMNVPAGARLDLVIAGAGEEVLARVERNRPLIERLARLSSISAADTVPPGAVTIALEDCALALPLADVIDVAAERARLEKAMGKLEKERRQIEGKLGNEKFLEKAPDAEVEKQRERLAAVEAERARLEAALSRIAEMA
jgi:valyl-tRNA synthetase